MIGLKRVNRLIQKIFSFIYILFIIDKVKIFLNYKGNSRNILWIKLNSVFGILKYLKNNDLLDDLIILDYLAKKNDYTIKFTNKIGKNWNSRIYYSITKSENHLNIYNYSEWLYCILELLEKQGNQIFPGKDSVRMWENKIFMHEIFEKYSIPIPFTIIMKHPLNDVSKIFKNDFIIKLPHSSGSKGLFHFHSYNHYIKNYTKYPIPFGSSIVVQERINMTFDLRVVINNFEYKSHYWRKNPKDQPWRPTATSLGSKLTYEDLPDHIVILLQEYSKNINLPFCAFDVAFSNDDYNIPLILEVSSSYQLNPINITGLPYKSYKDRLFIKNPYWKEYIDITRKEKQSIIEFYEKQHYQ